MKQIGLAENAYDAPVAVDDRKSADVVIDRQLHRFRYRLLRFHPHNVADHHIACVHDSSFFSDGEACDLFLQFR